MLGSKAENLLTLQELYPDNVPPFKAVPFRNVITGHAKVIKEIRQATNNVLQGKKSTITTQKRLASVADRIEINPAELQRLVELIHKKQWNRISIRTSAIGEDGADNSFAGQYVSFIDIKPTKQHLEMYIRKCFASLFSDRVLEYAQSKQLTELEIDGAVIIQEMFYGKKSGVLFTEDGRGNMTFASVDSWQNSIVEGGDAHITVLPRIGSDKKKVPAQMTKIATIALALEKKFKHPLDIEWSFNNDSVMLLQARPQTTATTDYTFNWDGTNISENYPGITLPLTYSFITKLYANVYPSFFRLMGMSEQKIQAHSWVFENTLGYIDGRVYYRIDNWYEIVKLIPGTRNQEFFEAMLNPAKQKVSGNKRPPITPALVVLTIRFLWLLLCSRVYSKKFAKKFSQTYKEASSLNWDSMSAEACLDHLHHMRSNLLVMWGIPILNDVRVMIFHGIFKTIIMKNADTAAYLEQLSGLSDRASVKPLQSLYALGQQINKALESEKVDSIDQLRSTLSWPKIEESAIAFIDAYGGRTPDELQLENPRLGDSILDVIQLAYASKDAVLDIKSRDNKTAMNQSIVMRSVTRFVVNNMRSAIDYRERFRFNRAQIFGTARQVYLSVGNKLAEAGVLDAPEDIFWLYEYEVENNVRGHAWEYNLKSLIASRKHKYDYYASKQFRQRVTGTGVVATTSTVDTTPPDNTKTLSGTGVAPGRITAPVIVVTEFDPQLEVTGKILVVKHVDPGWTLLLVQAAGVISEQGNALSHVAIVSREIVIPAIVGIRSATQTFKTGDVLTLDGSTGEIDYAKS